MFDYQLENYNSIHFLCEPVSLAEISSFHNFFSALKTFHFVSFPDILLFKLILNARSGKDSFPGPVTTEIGAPEDFIFDY